MAAQPKRKHSTRRTGIRLAAKNVKMTPGVICTNCKKLKKGHYLCLHCGK